MNPSQQSAPKHRIEIPTYSLSEELLNSISHGLGALFGAVALVLMAVAGARAGSVMAVVTGSIFGGTMVLLYTVSCLYHALKVNRAKRVFRVLDHCTIYLLIAGTYTPYTLLVMGGKAGWALFAVSWIGAAIGITFTAIDLKKFRVLSMIAYLAMGWVVVFAMKPLFAALPTGGILLLFAGGILYTIGAVLYAVGKKIKYMHSVFHFFVLAGSITHFLSLYLYVFLRL